MENRKKAFDFVIYEIYIRSFKDSNGDGIGDLNGVIEKLDYLLDLGVNALWLSPCYQSPNFDNGYDISDYKDIMQEFGTLDDWKTLLSKAHALGMKIIMDLVVNHTSSLHPWFLAARSSKENPYHDYYIWADAPKNDWQSLFGGSAWEFNPTTKEYYLHSFAVQQPDLNWENPNVRKACQEIVDFWVDLGVDGFRCDVLDFISKDFEQDKMFNGPRLHEYLQELFNREKTWHLFTVGECQSDEQSIVDICGKDRGELTTVFQFEHIHFGHLNKYKPTGFSLDTMRDTLVKWQYFCIEKDLIYMLFTDNHDQTFYLSRIGNDKEFRYECATALATAFYLLKGVPLLYQGQEFGSVNSYYDCMEEFNDVESIQYYKMNAQNTPKKKLMEEVNFGSRDNTRRPIAWTSDEKTSFGFSTATPWLKPPTQAKLINAEKDRNAEKSVWRFYKKLLAFRKENECIRYGDFNDLTVQKDCFVFERTYGADKCVVLCNFNNEKEIILPKELNEHDYIYALGNYKDGKPFCNTFRPFEVAVYKRKP